MSLVPDHLREDRVLATRLVVPPARIGWEYVQTEPARPFVQPEPVLRLPEPPSSGWLNRRMQQAYRDEVARRTFDHEQRHAAWIAAGEAHHRAEQERVARTPCWFPLVAPQARRIDVVGGSREGQDVLLAVLGASLVGSGGRITLVDLTGGRVGATLTTVISNADLVVDTSDLLAGEADPLRGVDAAELVEIVAAAVHPASRAPEQRDRRDRVAALIAAAVDGLTGPPSTRSLVDGLRVLNRTYRGGALTDDEVDVLSDRAHDVVVGERMADELRGLITRLEPLAAIAGDSPLDLLGSADLVVVTSPGPHTRHGGVLAELLTARLCAAASGTAWNPTRSLTIVVTGADQLSKPVLDELSRRCQDARIRLVLLFEELRDDSLGLFGGQGAATIVMQLGPHEQAEVAARAIGREHRFVLSQLSRQTGTTFTTGGGDSIAHGDSDSRTHGVSHGGSRQGLQGGSNWSQQDSVTIGHSTTRTQSSSWSLAESQNDGHVLARSYDFTVEPTQIQSLDTFAFVLVDQTDGIRRVRAGIADPRITELPLVAAAPR
jgi:hypothetical protein